MQAQKIQSLIISFLFLAVTALSGCSSGKNSDKTADAPPLAAATISNGVIKLGTLGAPNLIGGVDLTINLPGGVSVEADPNTGEAASGVVTSLGAASGGNLTVAKYIPASDGAQARLHIIVISAAGFPVGEFAEVRFNLAEGAGFPASDAFSVAGFSAVSPNGSTLSGVSLAPLSAAPVENAAAARAQVTVVGSPVSSPTPTLTMTVSSPTNTNTQTITGTLITGATLTVTANPPALVSALVITGTDWSAQVSGLATGDNFITAVAVISGETDTATADIILDLVQPFINIDTAIGAEKSAGLSGTAELGSTIMVVCDDIKADVIFFDDALHNATRWTAQALGLLNGGNHLCVVTAVDAAGNTSTQEVNAKPLQIDYLYPNLDVFVIIPVRYGRTATVSGTVVAGITPVMKVNGLPYSGSMTVNGSTWTCQVSGLNKGDNIITVTATDAAGRSTTRTGTVTAVDCNGSFSGAQQPAVSDALKALRIAVGLEIEKPADLLHADVFADDHIDLADAILILEKVADLIDNFPPIDELIGEILQ